MVKYGNEPALRNGGFCAALLFTFFCLYPAVSNATPAIDVWYGSNQSFGDIGQPQQWVNVLGNVSAPDGINALTYSLNGGPSMPLSIGPDSRRLWAAGDFNVELAYTDLQVGANTINITATDNLSVQTSEVVTVNYSGVNVWPTPFSTNWAAALNIADQAQIIDGLWTLEAGGTVRPVLLGYDRLLGIGDISWDNYEATVPITVHGLDPFCDGVIEQCGGGPGVGFIIRWQGHYDEDGKQPRWGFTPLGALGWMRWGATDPSKDRLVLQGSNGVFNQLNSVDFPFGITHLLKVRAETDASGRNYSVKLWPEGTTEPATWDIVGQDDLTTGLGNGSLLLVAHHVDASFGDVNITPLTIDTMPPVISNIQAATTETSATITWTTSEAANSAVAYGSTTAYEDGSVTSGFFTTSHSITLTGLSAGATYHYQVSSTDSSSNSASSVDLTFTTNSGGGSPSGMVSDNFDSGVLDTSVWTFVDPVGDSTVSMTANQASISMPAGSDHNVWRNNNAAPRLRQAASDTDFQIEIKLDSSLGDRFQLQGLLAEQDDGNLVRFDFYSDGSVTWIYSASFVNGNPTKRVKQMVTGSAPLYLRVTRQGNQWTEEYSYDGANWIQAVTYSHSLVVTSVSVFGGNAGGSPPAHTALFDYFVVDGQPPGSGGDTTPPTISNIQTTTTDTTATITWDTDEAANSQVSYGLTSAYDTTVTNAGLVTSHSVTLTGLSADTTYHYQVVSSDSSFNTGSSADLTLTTNAAPDTTPPVISNVQVSVTDTTATVTWDTDEAADSQVDYGPTNAYGETTGNAGLVTGHSITLTGLNAGATYHYQVSSTDGNANTGSSVDLTFTTNAAPDTTPPVISNVQVSVTDTTATVTWNTDEAADSQVDYGPTNAYGETTGNAGLVTGHSITLTGLNAGATYHYQVSSTDGNANTGSSVDLTFTTNAAPDTTPPVISNVQVSVTDTTATVTWNTDEAADSQVDYGPTNAYGETTGNAGLVTGHSITLTGLNAGATYHYQVSSTDGSANTGSSVDLTFTTDNETPNTDLTASWPMNEGAGTSTADVTGNGFNGTLVNGPVWAADRGLVFDGVNDYVDVGTLDVTGSEVTLTAWIRADNLANCSARDCRILSKANGISSADHYVMLSTIKSGTATRLRFRLKTGGTTATLIANSGDLVNNQWVHVAAVYDGSAMTLYKDGVSVGSIPNSGSITTNASIPLWIGGNPSGASDRPWDGQIDDVSIYNRALSAGEIAAMVTGDSTPPVISNLQVAVTDTTATITWDTDEPANSVVDYGLDATYGTTVSDAGLVTSHSVTINGLTAETLYHYQAASTDGSGNLTSEPDANFTTATQNGNPLTILQQPSNQTVFENDIATFSVTVTGTGTIDYQWRVNGIAIPGATNSSFTMVATLSNDGDSIDCIVSDDVTSTTSAPATLNVLPQIDPGANLALNKPATASSVENTTYTADKAFDGAITTRWGSKKRKDPQWIYVDLESVFSIDRVVLNWESAYSVAYQIEVSQDGATWTSVYSTTNAGGGIEDIPFTPTDARFVRLYSTQRVNSRWGVSLWEFEVYSSGL